MLPMSNASATVCSAGRPVLIDLAFGRASGGNRVPGIATDALLIVSAALLTAICARVSFPLPGTPVPVTLQTFAVLLTAAALGPVRGTLGMLLYVAMGLVGLPVFSDGTGGWQHVAAGATAGYLGGFVLSAAVVGRLARDGWDRRPWGAIGTMTLGNALIFAPGVTWLAIQLDLTLPEALRKGLYPFLPGAVVKTLAAGLLLPAAWTLVRRLGR